MAQLQDVASGNSALLSSVTAEMTAALQAIGLNPTILGVVFTMPAVEFFFAVVDHGCTLGYECSLGPLETNLQARGWVRVGQW